MILGTLPVECPQLRFKCRVRKLCVVICYTLHSDRPVPPHCPFCYSFLTLTARRPRWPMQTKCPCNQGFSTISEIHPLGTNSFLASHCCSHCKNYLFDTEIQPGKQIIATDNIASDDGQYIIPKGRMLRISAFIDSSLSSTGFLFSGLLAAGAFSPQGFAAEWDIETILGVNEGA